MNQVRAKSTTWRDQERRSKGSSRWWFSVPNFFRRQPEYVLVGAVVGGALLAYWAKNRDTGAGQIGEQGRTWPPSNQPAWHRPAARLGATEDQMEELVTPSARALEASTAGATGAAYELDPTSITSG